MSAGYRGGVSDRFAGKLTLPEDEIVAVDLEISPDNLTLRTESVLIGTWPLKYCRVSKVTPSVYRLSVDGEIVEFEPEDARGFAVVAAQRFKSSSLADRINVVRSVDSLEDGGERESPSRPVMPSWPSIIDLLKSPLLVGALVVAAMLVVGVLAWNAFFGADDAMDVPPVEVTATSSEDPPVSAFQLEPALFVVEWNRLALEFGADDLLIRSALPRGSFETSLAPLITLQGTTDDDGQVRSIVLVADPSGDSESDRLAIASWGIAMKAADPSLTGADRRDLLAELGLDVDRPELSGLDGETVRNGVRYSMQYFAAFSSVLLNIAPAG